MNQIKLTDLEIKEGFLCKDGVKLIKFASDGLGIPWGQRSTDYCKVKSATIWTEVNLSDSYFDEIEGGDFEMFLEQVSEDPKAYATDIQT